MKYNLLSDPLIRVSRAGRVRQASLPGLFAAMAREEVDGFAALRPHQNAAWHMFLVQLAALALWTAGRDQPAPDEAAWKEMLRGLTEDFPGDEPWHLVVEAAGRPAFLQSPRPADTLRWEPVPTADGLDLLADSKNFNLKRAVAYAARPEDWLYALVSLQTMQGYSGRQNCGIARMNGGSASRPLMGLAPGHVGDATAHPSGWWLRDVRRLLSGPRDPAAGTPGGPALLWCLEWPEGEQLQVAALDPWFIEVCRRVRLREVGGRMAAERSVSKKPRINAGEFHGNLGDPWTPIHKEKGASLTLGGDQGFAYRKVCELLFSGNWERPLLARHGPEETGDRVLVMEAFVRGQGKTNGFYSRRIAVPKPGYFASETAATLSEAQIEEIAQFDTALRNALARAAVGGDWDVKPGPKEYGYTQPARQRLQKRADGLFFQALWKRVAAREQGGEAEEQARQEFLQALREAAEEEFRAGLQEIPCASALRLRAEARAARQFHGGVRKNFPELFGKEGADAQQELKLA